MAPAPHSPCFQLTFDSLALRPVFLLALCTLASFRHSVTDHGLSQHLNALGLIYVFYGMNTGAVLLMGNIRRLRSRPDLRLFDFHYFRIQCGTIARLPLLRTFLLYSEARLLLILVALFAFAPQHVLQITLIFLLTLSVLDVFPYFSMLHTLNSILLLSYNEELFLRPQSIVPHVPKTAKFVHVVDVGLSRLPQEILASNKTNPGLHVTVTATDQSYFLVFLQKLKHVHLPLKMSATYQRPPNLSNSFAKFDVFDCVINRTLALKPASRQKFIAEQQYSTLKPHGVFLCVWFAETKLDAISLLESVKFDITAIAEEVVGGVGVIVLKCTKDRL
jgi:hypothetical protein